MIVLRTQKALLVQRDLIFLFLFVCLLIEKFLYICIMKLNIKYIVSVLLFCLLAYLFMGVAIQMATNIFNVFLLILIALGFSIGLTKIAIEYWFD